MFGANISHWLESRTLLENALFGQSGTEVNASTERDRAKPHSQRQMAIWYEIENAQIDELERALTLRSVIVTRLKVEDNVVGFACSLGKVTTDLEIHQPPADGKTWIVRHEGIHLLHPIQFYRLHAAIVDSLAKLNATTV